MAEFLNGERNFRKELHKKSGNRFEILTAKENPKQMFHSNKDVIFRFVFNFSTAAPKGTETIGNSNPKRENKSPCKRLKFHLNLTISIFNLETLRHGGGLACTSLA